MLVSNTLKSLFSNALYVVVALSLYSIVLIAHAADIQPGQKVFCAFPTTKAGMQSFRLNMRNQSKAYLVNGKRKIALSLSGALDSHTLLWNIPAKAKLGKYTFKVLKKQTKKSKQYFTCGKTNDYRLTNTPENTALTQTINGTIISNDAGFSRGADGSNGANLSVMTLTPVNSGISSEGFTVSSNMLINDSGSLQNYNGGSLTQNSGFNAGVTITNYVPNNRGIQLNLDGNFIASGSFFVATSILDEKFDVILSGEHTGNLKLDAHALSKCQASLKENYWDFTTFAAQSGDYFGGCSAYDQYKNYISNSVTTVAAACGLNISDNTNIVVNGLSMREIISNLQKMQADAALIAGCDKPPQ